MPRLKHTDDVEVPAGQVEISTEGPAIAVVEEPEVDIERIDAHRLSDKSEQERFMNELVTIHVEMDDDPNSPVFIPVGHNGVPQTIHRGTDQTVKRRFLYSLIAGKRRQFSCTFGKDSSGHEFNKLEPTSRPTYRLYVVRDENPRGRAWFNAVMQEQ